MMKKIYKAPVSHVVYIENAQNVLLAGSNTEAMSIMDTFDPESDGNVTESRGRSSEWSAIEEMFNAF